MKMLKLAYPVIFALVVTLAATGCRNHRPYGVTPIPRGPGAEIGQPGPSPTLPGGNPMPSQSQQQVQSAPTGGGQTASLAMFDNMLEDTNSLAPYTIHFSFNSAVIRNRDQSNLQAVAAYLNSNPSDKLLITGNCDERGTEEYNLALGARRALAARQALVGMGISSDRIRTISYGKDRPVNPAHNPTAWAENRRDDFVLLLPNSGM